MNFIFAAFLTLQSVDDVQKEIDALRPERLAWHDIAWKECPLEALKEAREKKKPIIAWVFLGTPGDERC